MSAYEENTYILDPNAPAEVQRLIMQGEYLNKQMHEPLAEQLHSTQFGDILDVACGPGVWCLLVGNQFPDSTVSGIDVSEQSIAFATMQAELQQLNNVSFQQMNMLKPLTFSDNSFDLVNIRMVHGALIVNKWMPLLQECMRILRPGGVLRLTEDEMPMSNMTAFEKLSRMSSMALKDVGMAFSADGQSIGVLVELPRLLQSVGCVHVQHVLHRINISVKAKEHDVVVKDLKSAYIQAKNFLIDHAKSTEQEQQTLVEQMLQEMDDPNFVAFWPFVIAWGEKPKGV